MSAFNRHKWDLCYPETLVLDILLPILGNNQDGNDAGVSSPANLAVLNSILTSCASSHAPSYEICFLFSVNELTFGKSDPCRRPFLPRYGSLAE